MGEPMNADRSPSAGVAGPDQSWCLLYRIGGVSAWLFVGMLVAAIVVAIATPAPPTAGGTATLSYIAAHRTLYIVEQQLWLVPGVFAMVTYLALYPALKHLDRSLAALGVVVGGSAWALTLAIPTTTTGAPALVYLSDQFMATADPARRAAFATAAEALIAQNRTTVVVGPLTTVGLLIVSIVMLKGVFPRAVAYLGVATGVLGISAEALRMVFEGFYGVYGMLLPVWMGPLAGTSTGAGRAVARCRGNSPDPGGALRVPRRRVRCSRATYRSAAPACVPIPLTLLHEHVSKSGVRTPARAHEVSAGQLRTRYRGGRVASRFRPALAATRCQAGRWLWNRYRGRAQGRRGLPGWCRGGFARG